MSYNDGWNAMPPAIIGLWLRGDADGVRHRGPADPVRREHDLSHRRRHLCSADRNGLGTVLVVHLGCRRRSTTISAAGASAAPASINLNAATLLANRSQCRRLRLWMNGIIGGFTIANGVVIENATGGKRRRFPHRQRGRQRPDRRRRRQLDGGIGRHARRRRRRRHDDRRRRQRPLLVDSRRRHDRRRCRRRHGHGRRASIDLHARRRMSRTSTLTGTAAHQRHRQRRRQLLIGNSPPTCSTAAARRRHA